MYTCTEKDLAFRVGLETSARQRNTAVVTLIAISPYTLYAFVNLVRLIINEERSNNSIVSNPCSVPMNNRNDVYGLNRCERFNSWVKIECSGGSRVVSRLFYYLSDAMRANARHRRCRQQFIKSDLVGMRALSISFSSLGKEGGGIRRVRVLRTVSAGNLLSQVGLARNLAIACCHATAVGQKPSRR